MLENCLVYHGPLVVGDRRHVLPAQVGEHGDLVDEVLPDGRVERPLVRTPGLAPLRGPRILIAFFQVPFHAATYLSSMPTGPFKQWWSFCGRPNVRVTISAIWMSLTCVRLMPKCEWRACAG